jgi:GNAT acetyltransferase-like protein
MTAVPQRFPEVPGWKQAERKPPGPYLVANERILPAPDNLGENAGLTLRVLETIAEFEELREFWSGWSNHPQADLDLFSIGLAYRPGVVRPHVMVIYRNGRPDGLLVGWIYQGPLDFKVGSINIFRTEARILHVVSGGFLGNRSLQNSRFLVRKLLEALSQKEIQAVSFSQLRVDTALYEVAKREPGPLCREIFTPPQTHRYMTLPATFDQYLKSRGRHCGNHLRRCQRLLAKDYSGRVQFESYRSVSEAEEFAYIAEGISDKTYQRALGVGFVRNDETRALLRTAAKKGALRASVLWVDGQPVAFVSGIVAGHTLHATYTGYDRAFERYCPGAQTMMRFIEELFEPGERVVQLDSGCGNMHYKQRLFDSIWEESPVWIFAPSAKGIALHALRAVSTSLHYVAMRLLEKSDHLRKLKKIWHRRLAEAHQKEALNQT